MKFNNHHTLSGAHAFLSASKHSWLNYDEDHLRDAVTRANAAALGTRMHALAAEHISLRLRMPKNHVTFNEYVNDAIGYRMTPEVVLFYSMNAFGTADAICFNERKKFLRIHDLKTGVSRVSMAQLHIYQAFFCLEYGFRPAEITSELRIYQNDDIIIDSPDPDLIAHICDQIVSYDEIIENMKE